MVNLDTNDKFDVGIDEVGVSEIGEDVEAGVNTDGANVVNVSFTNIAAVVDADVDDCDNRDPGNISIDVGNVDADSGTGIAVDIDICDVIEIEMGTDKDMDEFVLDKSSVGGFSDNFIADVIVSDLGDIVEDTICDVDDSIGNEVDANIGAVVNTNTGTVVEIDFGANVDSDIDGFIMGVDTNMGTVEDVIISGYINIGDTVDNFGPGKNMDELMFVEAVLFVDINTGPVVGSNVAFNVNMDIGDVEIGVDIFEDIGKLIVTETDFKPNVDGDISNVDDIKPVDVVNADVGNSDDVESVETEIDGIVDTSRFTFVSETVKFVEAQDGRLVETRMGGVIGRDLFDAVESNNFNVVDPNVDGIVSIT